MANKVAFVFLVLFGVVSYSQAATYYAPSVAVVQPQALTVDAQYEFTEALAEIFFNGFAKIVQAKVNVLLYIKRILIQWLVRGFFYLKAFVANNADFVSQMINLVAELLQTIIRSKPYFAVPQIIQTIVQDFPYPN